MASINERFLDFQVAQQIKWIRLQNRETREALAILKKVEDNVATLLRSRDFDGTPYTQARLEALRVQFTNIINALSTTLTPTVIKNVEDAAKLAAEIESAAFVRIMPAGLDVTTPNLGVLQTSVASTPFSGATVDDWAKSFNRSMLETTWREIVAGITEGETSDDMVRRIIGTKSNKFKDGALQPRRRGLEALVRTSINHATNQGRDMVWKANSDLLKGVRWVATLDTRTTPICQHRDGRVGPVVDSTDWTPPRGASRLDPPFARPPAHVNCRSTTTAITKSWRELGFDVDELPPGTRASMNGQVPGNLTYFDWLNRQNAAVQKDVLGPTRYDLWKQGGITPSKFQNDLGRQYTLDELRAKTPKAFDDAGL